MLINDLKENQYETSLNYIPLFLWKPPLEIILEEI